MAELAAELGTVGGAVGAEGDPEVVVPHRRRYSWHPPRWLPLVLVAGAALWAAGIWWMFAHTGSAEAEAPHNHAAALSVEVAAFNEKVDSLTKQLATLGQEREALAKRVAALESRPGASAVATPGTAPAVMRMDLGAAASAAARVTYPQGSEAVPGTPGPATVASAPRFFTNGVDRYSCSSFGSQAEAQEALAANVPGDPNRLDMNGNGVACEDITYAANAPKNLTPVAGRNGPAASVEPGPMPAEGVHHTQHP